MAFTRATKHEAKLRLALAGPAGAGKTYTALAIATGLANGGGVGVIDTERGSAAKYADLFVFDVCPITPPFHPQKYIDAIRDAEKAGYDVLVIDSMSHAWEGAGGVKDLATAAAAAMKTSNSFAGWQKATPVQNAFIDAILQSKVHVIVTMRSRQEYSQEQDGKGKTIVRKVGLAPVQRDGVEYEFDLYADMDMDNRLLVQKSRCPSLTGAVIEKPGAEVALALQEWLHGEPAPPEPAPAPSTPTSAPATTATSAPIVTCTSCSAQVPPRVVARALEVFGRVLCVPCAVAAKEKQKAEDDARKAAEEAAKQAEIEARNATLLAGLGDGISADAAEAIAEHETFDSPVGPLPF